MVAGDMLRHRSSVKELENLEFMPQKDIFGPNRSYKLLISTVGKRVAERWRDTTAGVQDRPLHIPLLHSEQPSTSTSGRDL